MHGMFSMSLQVPGSWRGLIEDPATIKLFLDFYRATEPPLSNQALECLVGSIYFCSVPRLPLQHVGDIMILSKLHGGVVSWWMCMAVYKTV